MKMTIVIDSEDREGVKNALEIARLMHIKYVGDGGFGTHKESFGVRGDFTIDDLCRFSNYCFIISNYL